MEPSEPSLQKIILIFLAFLFILNFAFLDYREFTRSEQKEVIAPTSIPIEPTLKTDNSCPQSCLAKIDEVKQSILPELTTASPTIRPTEIPSSGIREFFIPLGSGMSTASDWEDVYGLQVYLDSANYPNLKKAVFETSVRVPSLDQTVNVRLYNATDKQAVAGSEVSFPIGVSPTLLVSSPITLGSGNKLYQVQMKTGAKHQAYLDQSRIHLIID